MLLPEFNQRNVDEKIKEIKASSIGERAKIAEEIKANLKDWLKKNFTIDRIYSYGLDNLDKSIIEEWAGGISLAILNDNWTLIVNFPEQPTTTSKCRVTSQSVSGSYNPDTGTYTVTKSIGFGY